MLLILTAGGKNKEEQPSPRREEIERFRVTLANVNIQGGYMVSGKLAGLFPVQGDGLMSATFFNVTATIFFSFQKKKQPSSSSTSSSSSSSSTTTSSSHPDEPLGHNITSNNQLTIEVDSIDLQGIEMKIESTDHKNLLHEGYNEEANDLNSSSNSSTNSILDHSNQTTHHLYHSVNSFSSPSLSSNESSDSDHQSHSSIESMLFWRLVYSLQQKLELSVIKCLQEVIQDRQ